MVYYTMIIILILLTTVIIQFFTIHSLKKNAHDCMKRYDECFMYFKDSVELCGELQHQCEELVKTNRELNCWNERWMSTITKEEHKND